MKKRNFSAVIALLMLGALLLSLPGCGIGRRLRIDTAVASRDDVTVTLKKATAERKNVPARYEYSFSGTIENNSDVGVMKVIYTFSLYDGDGNKFRSFGETYDGVDKAIPPHGKVEFSLKGIKWGAQSVPAYVSIGIGSVQTETELPPATLPQPGEPLYLALGDANLANIRESPPVELAFHVDQGGYGRTATFEKGAELDKAVALLCAIRIGEETNEWVTDNYNWIRLTWEDGSETYISLNLRNLEHNIHSSPHMFALEHLNEFWAYAEDYLVED
ncbi:MAG: hypothetical protein IJH53_09125 [Oscillospiraceae bacterium]|nr:hypothetical protein [Oscillospiraceae bacterium]